MRLGWINPVRHDRRRGGRSAPGGGRRPARAPRRGAGALLLTGALALAGCGGDGGEEFAAEPVRLASVVERVSAPGSVQASNQADLTAPASAIVQELHVGDGEPVRAGQVVAVLTSAEVDTAVRQAESALTAASELEGSAPDLGAGASAAALDAVHLLVRDTTNTLLQTMRTVAYSVPEPHRAKLLAHLEESQERLADTRREARRSAEEAVSAVTRQQTASLESTMQAATAAQRAQAEAALEVAREQRERLTLTSPIDGTVQLGRAAGSDAPEVPELPGGGQLPEGAEAALSGLTGGGGGGGGAGPLLRVGSRVAAGQVVASVLDVSRLTVAAEVDETDVALVRQEQLAEVELDAYPGERFKARVLRVALQPTQGQASALGGVSYRVDLYLAPAVAPEGPVPRPGMTATVSIRVRAAHDALSVASSALVGSGAGQGVYVIDEETNRVELRPVELGAAGEDRVAVTAGLAEGELVVTRGAQQLADDQEYPGH